MDIFREAAELIEADLAKNYFPAFALEFVERYHPFSMDRHSAATQHSIVVESPEVLNVVIGLLKSYYKASSGLSSHFSSLLLSLSSNSILYLVEGSDKFLVILVSYFLDQIMILVDSIVPNLATLCGHGLMSTIIDAFEDVLKNAEFVIQPQMLNIISQLGRYSMSKLELRKFLGLMKAVDSPTNLASTLVGISEHQHSDHAHPRYFVGQWRLHFFSFLFFSLFFSFL